LNETPPKVVWRVERRYKYEKAKIASQVVE